MNFRFLNAQRVRLTTSYWKITFRLFMYALLPYAVTANFIVAAKVTSGSMTPTILTHDISVMTKYSIRVYDILSTLSMIFSDFFKPAGYLVRKFPILLKKIVEFRTVQVGDVVTFVIPGRDAAYTKRIVAKEGDTVQMYYGALFINGKALTYVYKGKMESVENNKVIYGDVWRETNNDKTYDVLYAKTMGRAEDCSDILYVPKNSFVVFGDNRHDSADTRSFVSFIHESDIIYQVVFNLFSNSNITTLYLPELARGMRREYMLRLV